METILIELRDSDLREAANVFLKAFEITKISREADVLDFWNLLSSAGVATFISAKQGGDMVGLGALIAYKLSAWIAFMAVLPELRSRGLGNRIMIGLMDEARSLGIPTLKLDATNLGEPLYTKHGFRREYRVAGYEIELPASSTHAEPKGIEVGDAIPQWCLEMDRDAFGDDRSPLLKSVVARGGQVIVARDVGYGLLWKDKVGPVVAEHGQAAVDIVMFANGLGAKNVYVPLHHELPGQFLADLREAAPKTSITCCQRMTSGVDLNEKTRLVFASFSAATG